MRGQGPDAAEQADHSDGTAASSTPAGQTRERVRRGTHGTPLEWGLSWKRRRHTPARALHRLPAAGGAGEATGGRRPRAQTYLALPGRRRRRRPPASMTCSSFVVSCKWRRRGEGWGGDAEEWGMGSGARCGVTQLEHGARPRCLGRGAAAAQPPRIPTRVSESGGTSCAQSSPLSLYNAKPDRNRQRQRAKRDRTPKQVRTSWSCSTPSKAQAGLTLQRLADRPGKSALLLGARARLLGGGRGGATPAWWEWLLVNNFLASGWRWPRSFAEASTPAVTVVPCGPRVPLLALAKARDE